LGKVEPNYPAKQFDKTLLYNIFIIFLQYFVYYIMKKTKKIKLLHYKRPYCIKRSKTQKRNAVVDSHFHMRPFGGSPIEIKKMINILKRSGILFVEIEGVGQKILNNPKCTYYKDCANSIVKNTISNDILNAQLLIDNNLLDLSGININLSMTFPDLSKPKEIVKGIHYLDKEYPSLFNWMGELNVVKQSLFSHKVKPISLTIIPQWKYFMKILRDRKMPLSLHCDLGNNADNYKYLSLMERILFLYPKNIIVWVHLGLSKELTNIDPKKHTELLDSFLTKYKNLYFDISWRVLYDQLFHDPQKKILYVELMNKFPERFLTGTDFVNSITKNEKIYKEELRITSLIVSDLNNKAFRQIALGQNYLDLIHSKYKAPYICRP